MTATPDLVEVGEKDWDTARRRLVVIRALAQMSNRTRRRVAEAAAKIDCGVTQTYDLLAPLPRRPRLTSLVPKRRGRKQGRSMLARDVDELVRLAIEETFLTRQKPLVSDLVDEVRRRSAATGLRAPSRGAVERRLNARPAAEVVARRSGRKAARPVRSGVGSLEAPWPLSLIQIDHTPVDVIVVDSVTRAPFSGPG